MMYVNRKTLILASGSPRRKELLSSVGVSFTVIPSNIPEHRASETPEEMVCRLSLEKAAFVALSHVSEFILAVDTDVIFDGIVFGKPESVADAQRMLGLLSGNTHKVVTVATLLNRAASVKSQIITETAVTFRQLTDAEISAYAFADSVLDKAGAYGAQNIGQCIIDRIDGSFSSVIGLDLSKTVQLLLDHGVIAVANN